MWRGGSAHLFEVELLEAAFGVGLEQLHLRGSPTVTENATRAWVRRETITHGLAMRVLGWAGGGGGGG